MYKFTREQSKYYRKNEVEVQFFEEREELRETEVIEDENNNTKEIIIAYYYHIYTLPWRDEFNQIKEVDESGNIISEDYIDENYETLLSESKSLYYERLRFSYIAKSRELRYNEIESTYVANRFFDTMNAERSVNLLRNAVSDFKEGERVNWVNLKKASLEVSAENTEEFENLSKEVSRNLQLSYDKLDRSIAHIMALGNEELYTFDTEKMWQEL